MLDGGSLASHSSQHVDRCSSVVSHHKRSHCGCFSRPGTQGSVISAFNPLAAKQCVLCRWGSPPQSVKLWLRQLKCLCQRSTSSAGNNGPVVVLNRVYQTMPSSAPKLANILLILFQVGLALHTIGICCLAISAFLEPHQIHKASNHPVILKQMNHFHLQCPPSCECFDLWEVEHFVISFGKLGTSSFSHYL